jgi:hypothetical protein
MNVRAVFKRNCANKTFPKEKMIGLESPSIQEINLNFQFKN